MFRQPPPRIWVTLLGTSPYPHPPSRYVWVDDFPNFPFLWNMYPFPGGMTLRGEAPRILSTPCGAKIALQGTVRIHIPPKRDVRKIIDWKVPWKGDMLVPWRVFSFRHWKQLAMFWVQNSSPQKGDTKQTLKKILFFFLPDLGWGCFFSDVWLFYWKVGWLGDLQYVGWSWVTNWILSMNQIKITPSNKENKKMHSFSSNFPWPPKLPTASTPKKNRK